MMPERTANIYTLHEIDGKRWVKYKRLSDLQRANRAVEFMCLEGKVESFTFNPLGDTLLTVDNIDLKLCISHYGTVMLDAGHQRGWLKLDPMPTITDRALRLCRDTVLSAIVAGAYSGNVFLDEGDKDLCFTDYNSFSTYSDLSKVPKALNKEQVFAVIYQNFPQLHEKFNQ